MTTIVIRPLPGAGLGVRVAAWLRGISAKRLLRRLTGAETVVLQGRVCIVRARPLGVCRDLVPALIRCSRRFAEWDVNEALYDDLVTVLALGLNVPRTAIEQLTVSPEYLAPVVSCIAQVNGLHSMEAGRAGVGEFLQALMTKSTGTTTAPSSSAPPDGRGLTSTTR